MLPSHLLYKVALLLFSLFYTVVSENLTFCYQGKSCYELNDITFQHKWNSQLNEKLQKVSQIRVHDLHLNEKNYVTLFSHKLPNVKKIIFWSHEMKSPRKQYLHKNPLTPKIIQTIFRSVYFSQLEELDLCYTNLDFRHFLFLETIENVINSNLNILILTGNYLEKRAFQLLERINFNGKIETLALSQNSLISPESIKSLLKIIKSSDGSRSHVKNMTVYNTQITTENLIELLENIQVQKMTNLNLARNPFQHSKKFTIPFNNSFYEFLSKTNFSSLKRLSLTQLDLDEEQLPYLKNLKLESLETLELSANFITDDYFGTWISKQNMPKLAALHLEQNSISDLAIKTLAQQSFPNLTQLRLAHNRKLTPKHLHYLAMINSSKWTYLDLSRNSVLQTALRTFFQNKSFDNLLNLRLETSGDTFRIFDFLPWQSMKKLQFLEMIQTDFSWSVQSIAHQNISFPQLKKWSFGGDWITKYHISTLISDLRHFGPQLELVEILGSGLNEHTLYVNLSELNFESVPNGMYFYNLGFMTVRKPESGQNFQLLELVFGNQGSNFLQAMLHYSFFGQYEETDLDYTDRILHNPNQLNIAIEYLKKIMRFDKLEFCIFNKGSDFAFFKKVFFKEDPLSYIQEYKRFASSGSDYKASLYMPYLQKINYVRASSDNQECPFLYYLTKMQMPLLQEIAIVGQNHKEWIKLSNKLLKQQNTVRQIHLINNKLNCQKFNRSFDSATFSFLKKLVLSNNQIQSHCLKSFIDHHNLIRSLDFTNNFLQTGVFDSILAQNSIILTDLKFSLIQIGNEQFSKISALNRQFIFILSADSIAIDSSGILWLIGNSTSISLFPRCVEIHLGNNNINETGVQALLQTGMPFIMHISFSNSDNSNLMNDVLSYPNRFVLISIKTDIYGLNSQLDQRSTRHIENLQIQSSSLALQDYKVLSEMNFNKLEKAILTFQNICECQILNYILKIVQNANAISLIVKNQKIKAKTMTDHCISQYSSTQIYMRNLDRFNIIWVGEYFYIPKFYAYFYSQGQLVKILMLENCLIGDQEFIRIVQNCNLEHLWAVILINNLLTSQSVSKFFQNQWTVLKHLDLGNNLIGSEGLKNIVGKSFNDLLNLALHSNQIDIEGIKYLTQASFISLAVLILDGNDITKEGFLQIFQMNAPKLTLISLKNILMTENDLVWALERIQIQKFPFLSMIKTNIKLGWKNAQRLKKLENEKLKRVGLRIIYEEFYLDSFNKAVL